MHSIVLTNPYRANQLQEEFSSSWQQAIPSVAQKHLPSPRSSSLWQNCYSLFALCLAKSVGCSNSPRRISSTSAKTPSFTHATLELCLKCLKSRRKIEDYSTRIPQNPRFALRNQPVFFASRSISDFRCDPIFKANIFFNVELRQNLFGIPSK